LGTIGSVTRMCAAITQATGLGLIIAVMVTTWPRVSLWALVGPLALIGGGQSLLFAGLFRVALTDIPVNQVGIGGGVLITLQQSGLALWPRSDPLSDPRTTRRPHRVRRRRRHPTGHRRLPCRRQPFPARLSANGPIGLRSGAGAAESEPGQ